MDEFPKALTNADGEQIIVQDAEEEERAKPLGYCFGGPGSPESLPKRKAKAG